MAIRLDNSKRINNMQYLLKSGKDKFNIGATYEEKKEGLYKCVEGMKELEIIISLEKGDSKAFYEKILSDNNVEISKMIDQLEKAKTVSEKPVAMAMGGGKGGDKKDDENEKFKQSLAECIITEKPNVSWDDIAGLVQAKKSLQETVVLPIKFPEIFQGARIPWKGILLYGPPGTGKTYLAKACAKEADGTFFSISSSDLISKYVGESEKLIKALFNMAREKKPCIIFIDEVDSLAGARSDGENEASRRVKTEFLVQMQGVGHDDRGVLVLGATNLPWAIDPAIRRRFEKRVYIPLPEEDARLFLLKHDMKTTPNEIQESDFKRYAQKTAGYSGSDISILVRDAIYGPVRRLEKSKFWRQINVNGKMLWETAPESEAGKPGVVQKSLMDIKSSELSVPIVSIEDFENALMKSKPSVNLAQLDEYIKFTSEFGQEG